MSALCVKNEAKNFSRKRLDELTDFVKTYIVFECEVVHGGEAKFSGCENC